MKIWLIPILFLSACIGEQEDLCTKYDLVYPDHISGRVATPRNVNLLKGSEAYAAGNYELAVTHFTAHSAIYTKQPASYLYKAVSQLQLGKPYDAERTLDQLEGLPDKSFSDQVDYYNTLCLICSGQPERALKAAKQMSEKSRHSYLEESREMVKDLAKIR